MLRLAPPTALVLLALLARGAAAQAPDTLATVRVEAARSAGGVARAPFSVAVEERPTAERLSDPTLETALRALPGLFVADRENPSLGERLVVRGQGYRSPFGVRGVQVVLDGVPLTLADGQATLGIVDPALVRRAELVRGPAGALWGNGSGGVLFLSTIPEADGAGASGASATAAGGGWGELRAVAEAAGPVGPRHPQRPRAGAAVSHARRDGYRAHSASEVTRARVWADQTFGRGPRALALRLVGALEDAPTLQHPGALTAEQLAADRRQADARFVAAEAGKAVRQAQGAARLVAPSRHGAFRATVYGLARDLDNPLPFGYISLDRAAGGARLSAEHERGPLALALGADASVQRDRRRRSPNEGGRPAGAPTLDQLETVASGALFARARWALSPRVAASAALRADRVRFTAADRRLDDGDQSGARTLGALSPQLGLTVRARGALVFASVSTGFETPTTTELVNRPDGGGGFNPELRPQRALGVEVGARGLAGRLRYDVAAYAMAVRDGLAPSEGPTGQTFFANRTRTAHRGVEAAVEWRPSAAVALSATYAWARLRVAEGELAGAALPGVPEHRAVVGARLGRGLFVAPELAARSALWADDANTARADAAVTLDVTVGHEGLRAGRGRLLPFARLANAFGAEAVGSVAINAFGGRFFEPAAGRAVTVGVRAELAP